VASANRLTSVKTRILGDRQQIVRIDRESVSELDAQEESELLRRLQSMGPFDAYVISDYGKGVVNARLMEKMREARAAGKIVLVDPKQGNFELYRGVSCITPNAKEAGAACHRRVEDDASAAIVATELQERLATDWLLITRGEHGMTLRDGEARLHHIPTRAREVFDVTGAGDTVIASFACASAAGATALEAAQLANSAAGEVVREVGTASVLPATLRAAWLADPARGEDSHGR
ncbi:MAG TPA: PfkB family carbohydrate kinase, partial [Candidatus Krumholzibacteria bacterium]